MEKAVSGGKDFQLVPFFQVELVGINCVPPTVVTHGQEAGNPGVKWPCVPFVVTFPELGSMQEFPWWEVPVSPELTMTLTPRSPSFKYSRHWRWRYPSEKVASL